MVNGKVLKTIIDISGNINPSLGKSIKGVVDLLGGLDSAVLTSAGAFTAIGVAVEGIIGIGKTVYGVLKDSVEAAAEWETATSSIVKVTPGLRDQFGNYTKAYYDLSDELLKIGTEMPVDIYEMSDAITKALQDGTIKTVNGAIEAAKSVTKGSVALDMSMSEVSDYYSTLRINTKKSQKELDDYADYINYLGEHSALTPSELLETSARLSGMSDFSGFSPQFLTAMTAATPGLDPSSVSTTIKNLIKGIEAGSTSGKASIKRAYEALNLDPDSMAELAQEDAETAVFTFFDALEKNVPDPKRVSVISDFFRASSLEGGAILASNYDLIKDYLDIYESGVYKGSVDEEYRNQEGTYANNLQKYQNALEVIKIKAGQELLPTLTDLVSSATTFLTENGDTISNMISSIGEAIINPQAIETLESLLNLAEMTLPVINTQIQITSTTFKGITTGAYWFIGKISNAIQGIKKELQPVVSWVKSAFGWFFDRGSGNGGTGGWGPTGFEQLANNVRAQLEPIAIPLQFITGLVKNFLSYLEAIPAVNVGVGLLPDGLAGIATTLGTIIGKATTSKSNLQSISSVNIMGGSLFGGLSSIVSKLSNIVSYATAAKDKISSLAGAAAGIGSSIGQKIGSVFKGSSKLKGHAAGGFSSVPAIFGEAGPEVAISFDPKYRSQNVGYWQRAGQLLGMLNEKGALLSGSGSGSGSGSESGGITVVVENKQTITVSNGTVENVRRAISASDPDFIDKVAAAIRQAQEGRYSPNGNCFVY